MPTIRDAFARHLVNRVSEATGRNRNLVMARVIDRFCSTPARAWQRPTIEHYAVDARVYLEERGYILYAQVNPNDRRVRLLCPTSKFPMRPENLANLAERVSRAIQDKMNERHYKWR